MPLEIADAPTGPPRRVVMKAAVVTCLAAAMSGCETYGAASADQGDAADESPGTGQSSDATGGAETTALTDTGKIPVGGGKVFDGENVVVTQPVDGTFVAFSAECTHAGCTVATVSNGTINCPCHGSTFSIEDGSVAGGPATRALSKVEISVEGTAITLV